MKEKPEEPATLVRDPEFVALDKIAKLLASLDHDARWRILNYLDSKYRAPLGQTPKE